MDFGIFLDFSVRSGQTQGDCFREYFDLVDLAEETGLDTVWLGESHFNQNRIVSAPIVVAGSIATRTERLRVGMAVQVLPLINPLRIAEEAATVDQISEGRFEFGVGRSGNLRAYETMGIPYEESRDRFQEALEIILKAWEGETFSYHGEFNQIENLSFFCDAGFGLHLLGYWVRERQAMSLEEGVRRLTSEPADIYGIPDRGRLSVGAHADLLLFDPLRVDRGPSRRVFDLPAGAPRLTTDAIGVHGVWVNGARIVDENGVSSDDARPGQRPGQLLREFAS